jgi:hypothetical protein
VIHVFVETNWVVEVCAPAFRRTPAALALLSSAESGEISLHVPGIALREGRSVIRRKYQPKESKTLQDFRRWARDGGMLRPDVERVANEFLRLFSNTVSAELGTLDQRIGEVESSSGVHVFALGDAMLQRALRLRDEVPDAELGAFDEAILGGILVRASELGTDERSIFCTLDRDLSPADRQGKPRPRLKAIYDAVGIEVRTSFDIS